MMTGLMIGGRGDIRLMVCTPAPGMLNRMVSVSGLALAAVIAWRKELLPLSSVLLTMRGAPTAGAATTGPSLGCRATPSKQHSASTSVREMKVKADRECDVPNSALLLMGDSPLRVSARDSMMG